MRKLSLLEKLCLFTIALALLAALPSFLVPPGLSSEGDALDYRIPLLKWMLRHRAYPDWPWTFVDDYPMLGELLILPFFALHAQLARLVPIVAYSAVALFSGLILAELLPPKEPARRRALFLFGTASTLGLQPVLVQSNHVMVDNIAAAFALASLWLLLRGRITAAGLAMAGALATRYMIWGALPGAVLALLWLKRGEAGRGKLALRFTALALLGAAPFLARNTVLNQNPFYPLLTGLFNGVENPAFAGWGRGTSLTALLLFPYDLLYTNTFVNELFDTRTWTGGFFVYKVGTLFYLQLGAVLLATALAGRRIAGGLRAALRDPAVAALALFGTSHFLFWFYGSQQLRFLGCGLALLSLLLLRALFSAAPPALIALLALAPLYNVAGVQAETWSIAFGWREPFAKSGYVESARRCFKRAAVPLTAVVGYPNRDVTNGFFDRDFVFVSPNNLFFVRPGVPAPPAPDYLYSGLDLSPRDGFELWPREKPCLLRRL